uniref:NADH dehydrogenase subunit 4L n=1 Tax=Metacrinus rotundus TaxID=228699 RepID=UPI00226CEE48|nr:NADH dehydrogenase subunit 4L [Metacrinus rotundus]UZH93086.1 NADH dehydrogenase subunit 4L [Metacrinus rotundus]
MGFLLFFISSIFFLGVLGIILNRVHLLTVMLCLELLLVSLFLNVSVLSFSLLNFSFCGASLVLLTFSACEAGVGLSLLVAVSRSHSSGNVFVLNLLRF